MNRACQSYKIELLNESYTITSDEEELHIAKIVEMVNACAADFSQKMPSIAPHRLAILTALHFASISIHNNEYRKTLDQKGVLLADRIDTALKESL